MDISKLNLFNLLGFSKKTEKVNKTPAPGDSVRPEALPESRETEGDSIAISQEGLVKTTAMEVKEELNRVRQDKVQEIKAKISSGDYQVSAEELARVLLRGKTNVYEELK